MRDRVVYVHKKKTNGQVFYVGFGSNKRPYQINKSSRTTLWWSLMQEFGIVVEPLIPNLTLEEAREIEKIMIAGFGRIDIGTGQLTNNTRGGEGGVGPAGIPVSKETRNKISKTLTGRKQSKESIDKMRKSLTGRKRSDKEKNSIRKGWRERSKVEYRTPAGIHRTSYDAAKANKMPRATLRSRVKDDRYPDWICVDVN